MKDTLLYLLQSIIDHPDSLSIEETIEDEGHSVLTIHAHGEDMGKIIGKGGRIIRAIRDLIKLIAMKQNVYVDVVLAESQDKSDRSDQSSNPTNE